MDESVSRTSPGTSSGTSIGAPVDPSTGLLRVVSRWEVVSIALNDVIGSGVYLLPAAAAALVVLLVVLCFAEAATYFDEPGGAYLYTRTAFGDLVGFGPRFLEWVHPRFHTPAAALLVQGGIALPLALTGSFTGLAALSVVARLATYLGTAAAVPVLRRKLGAVEEGFRLPGGPVIPVAACVVGVGLGASAGRENLLAATVALVAGLVIFRLRRR